MFTNVLIRRGFTEITYLFREVSKMDATIAGGYCRYMCSPHKDPAIPRDVDVFCKTEEAFNNLKAFFEKEKLEIKFENDISISYRTHTNDLWIGCPEIQLIKPMKQARVVTVGSVEDILNNFDYSVTRIAIVSETECLADEHFLQDEKKRFLRVMNIHCPIGSVSRLMKYFKKGYWTKPFQILKLFQDWDQRDTDYRLKLAEMIIRGHEWGLKEDNEKMTEEERKNNDGLSEEERKLLYEMMLVD
jgi:hypothetical protein